MRRAWPLSWAGMHKLATALRRSSASMSARTSPAAAADFEKRPKGGPESLLKIRAQRLEGRVSRMQRRGEPALGGNEAGISLHPTRQGFEGLVLGRKDRRGVRAGVDFATEDGSDQVRALRKVPVNGADADAGLFCDFSHRSVHPGGREHRLGRLEQRVDVPPCVGAHAPIRAVPRLQSVTLVFRSIAHHASLDKTEHCSVKSGMWFRSSQVNAARLC